MSVYRTSCAPPAVVVPRWRSVIRWFWFRVLLAEWRWYRRLHGGHWQHWWSEETHSWHWSLSGERRERLGHGTPACEDHE